MMMSQFNLTLNIEDLKDQLADSNLDSIVKSSLVLILNQVMAESLYLVKMLFLFRIGQGCRIKDIYKI
jgi:hypothetical protein